MLPVMQAEPAVGGRTNGGGLVDILHADHGLLCEADVGYDDPFLISGLGACELQLGDTWGGTHNKMSVSAPVMKIRKKQENKPQSQINKCDNEKRRRELENDTINQLEELLAACLSDVKQPDKNGIVQQASEQIRQVLEKRREIVLSCCRDCPPICARHCRPNNSVGDVTSTQHHHAITQLSEITTLIEALKHYTSNLGWVLLEINSDGNIECVTENIRDLAKWDRADLYKQSIYNYVHVGDHQKISPILQSNVEPLVWSEATGGGLDRLKAVRARLRVKGTHDEEFVEVSIHAAPVRSDDRGSVGAGGGAESGGRGDESAGGAVCVLRRAAPHSPAEPSANVIVGASTTGAITVGPSSAPSTVTKQLVQITFKVDRNGGILSYDLGEISSGVSSLCGTRLSELAEPSWRSRLLGHIRDAPPPPVEPSTLGPFRLRVAADRPWLTVRAHSRLFRGNPHSNDIDFIMSTYTILGEEGAMSPSSGVNSNDRTQSPMEQNLGFCSEFDFNEFGTQSGGGGGNSSWNTYDRSQRPSEDSYGSYPFPGDSSGSEGRRSSTPVAEESLSRPPPSPEANRLRTLLSKKPIERSDSSNGNPESCRILKDLLKAKDEDSSSSRPGPSGSAEAPRTPLGPLTPHGGPLTPASPHHPPQSTSLSSAASNSKQNDALLRSLIEKSDEEGDDSRKSELRLLLQQNGAASSDADQYRKRKLEEASPSPQSNKRPTTEVSSSASSGQSELCKKNQMLAFLLARDPKEPTTPLPSPNPVLRPIITNGRARTPRLTVPHGNKTATLNLNNNSIIRGPGPQGSNVVTSNASIVNSNDVRQLSMMLQQQQQQQRQHPSFYDYQNAAAPGLAPQPPQQLTMVDPNNASGEPTDCLLSAILDQVIELAPYAPPASRSEPQFQVLKEKMAINEIQKSLMQCETAVKSPVSPGGMPNAYSPPGMYNNSNQSVTAGTGTVRVSQMVRGGGAPPTPGDVRAMTLAAQQRTRLLQAQQSQQMLVSQGAEHGGGSDLGSTIDALLSSSMPPNVALSRTDYPQYHQNQVNQNFASNSMTSQQQQNPMLSAQLSSGYANSSAATQSVYARQMRPHLQQQHMTQQQQLQLAYASSGSSANEYCDYSRLQPRPEHHHMGGVPSGQGSNVVGSGGGGASDYVRAELRAVVGARTRLDPNDPSHHYDPGPPPGGAVVGETSRSVSNTSGALSTTTAVAGVGEGDETIDKEERSQSTLKSASSLLQKLLSE